MQQVWRVGVRVGLPILIGIGLAACTNWFAGTESGNPSFDEQTPPTLPDDLTPSMPAMSVVLPGSQSGMTASAPSSGAPSGTASVPFGTSATTAASSGPIQPSVSGSVAPSVSELPVPVPASSGTFDGTGPTSGDAPTPGPSSGNPWPTGAVPGVASSAIVGCLLPACLEQASAAASALSQPSPVAPPEFVTAECETLSAGPGCVCATAAGDRVELVGDAECLVNGRLECLLQAEEFLGCEPGMDAGQDVCAVTCALIEQRLAEDAQTSHLVEVRSAGCAGANCEYVLQADGVECYSGPALELIACPL